MKNICMMSMKVCSSIMWYRYLYLDYLGDKLNDRSREEQQEIDTDSTDNPLIVTLDGKRHQMWDYKMLMLVILDSDSVESYERNN